MRLLHTTNLILEDFPGSSAQKYAILSHTWGDEELLFEDISDPNKPLPSYKKGYDKVKGSCDLARDDGYDYIWIDTCCIDKSSSAELSEAINSMFQWYADADICYAYLSDVPGGAGLRSSRSKFQTSRWFRRGWTLQELLAPKSLVFYASDWEYLGTKAELSAIVESITGIPVLFIKRVKRLKLASVAQRMSWAAHRETTRIEDLAYCLLGIFGITMPMVYGEGDQAFIRLQEHIMERTRDHSILAWGLEDGKPSTDNPARSRAAGVLATTPADFANSGHIVPRDGAAARSDSLEVVSGSLRITIPILVSPTETIGLLNCGPVRDNSRVVGIPLVGAGVEVTDEYIRPPELPAVFRPCFASARRKTVYIQTSNGPSQEASDERLWVYDDDEFGELGLRLIDVSPLHCWDREQSVITSRTESESAGPTLIRLRHNNDHNASDFVLIIGSFTPKEISAEIRNCVVTCCRDSTLNHVAESLYLAADNEAYWNSSPSASNELVSLRLRFEPIDGESAFFIKPEALHGREKRKMTRVGHIRQGRTKPVEDYSSREANSRPTSPRLTSSISIESFHSAEEGEKPKGKEADMPPVLPRHGVAGWCRVSRPGRQRVTEEQAAYEKLEEERRRRMREEDVEEDSSGGFIAEVRAARRRDRVRWADEEGKNRDRVFR